MQVVVAICIGGLTVESDLHILVLIRAQINLDNLAVNRCIDLIVYITGTFVGPLSSDIPILTIEDKDSKHIVFLCTGLYGTTCRFRQRQVKAQFITVFHLNRRTNDPLMAFSASGIQIEVICRIREDIVLRSFQPTGRSSNQLFTAVHYCIQRYIIAFPIGRKGRFAEALMIRNACSGLHRDLFAITGERSLNRSVAQRSYTNIIIRISLQALNIERILIGINGSPIRLCVSTLLVLHFPCVCIGIFIPCNLYGVLRSLTCYFLQTARFGARTTIVKDNISQVEMVITGARIRAAGGLTVECNLNTLTGIYTQIKHYLFSQRSDVVIDILGTAIVPFTKNGPRCTIVYGRKDDKLIIILRTGSNRIC